jgi:hypothetical protein
MTSKRLAPLMAIGLTLLGGATAIAGALTPWYDVPNGVTVGPRVITGRPAGWETTYGLIALIAAGAIFLLALFSLSGRMRVVLGGLILVGAGIAIAYAVFALRDPKGNYIDFVARKASSANSSAHEIRLSLESLFQVNNLQAKAGVGSLVTIIGGGLSFVSGLLLMVGRKTKSPSTQSDKPA